MTHASLFSGIGGFDLAAEWAGWTNAFNCEIDSFCRKVLKYHFPMQNNMKTLKNQISASGETVSTCLPEVSPVNRSRSQENAKEPMTTATCGPRCSVLFGLFDRDGSLGKTFTASLIGRTGWSSTRCVLTWRRKDTKCSRTLYRLAVSALPTDGTDAGLLPTVQTQGLKRCEMGKTVFMPLGLLPPPKSQAKRKGSVSKMAMGSDGYQTGAGSRLNPRYVTEMMGFPVNWLVSPFLRGAENRSKPAETP